MAKSWTAEEDVVLTEQVNELSCDECPEQYRADCPCGVFKKKKTWEKIGKVLNRSYGSVQGRWCSVLDPMLDNSPWTPELDACLLRVYKTEKTWVTRSLALARAMPNKGKRRNGGDVCARYFFLKKRLHSTD